MNLGNASPVILAAHLGHGRVLCTDQPFPHRLRRENELA